MAAVDELITEHLDIWTSAVKRKSSSGRGGGKKVELYGVKKLRELILDLAVRGLLVPQDPEDEPASVLISSISSLREKLIASNKVKKQKLPKSIGDEINNFDLPSGWERISLSHLGFFTGGKTPSKANSQFWSGEIPWVTPKDMKSEYVTKAEDHITEEGLESGLSLVMPESLLFVVRSGILRRKFPVAINKIECTVNQDLKVLNLYEKKIAKYLLVMMQGFESYILRTLTKTGTTVESIRFDDFSNHYFILPPLKEQHRIVAKVDELMALCDQLDQQSEASLTAHQTLVQTLLDALTQAAASQPDNPQSATDAPTPFEQAWNRLAEHFDTVFTTEDSIEQLKQTILQLAVMGKLVPQDPNDEPAGVLLERIAAEKAELVKAKKIKKQKALPEIGEEEKSFLLPEGWEWINLSEMFAIVTDGDHQAPPKSDSGIPFLVIGNLNTGTVNFTNCRYVPREYYENLDWSRKPTSGDLLYTVTGSFGIPIVVTEAEEFCVQRHVAILKACSSTPVHYISCLLRSKYSYQYASGIATGIAQKTVPLTGLRKMPIALPPEQELTKIVVKVEELIDLCDGLKANLNAANATEIRLADAVTEQGITKRSLECD